MVETLRQEGIARLNPDLMKELEVLFLEFSEKKGFPDGYCTMISSDAAGLGLRYQEGYFETDFADKESNLLKQHAWCEDTDKVIVDLTAHQFNANLRNPLPRGIQIVSPKNPLYGKFLRLGTPFK